MPFDGWVIYQWSGAVGYFKISLIVSADYPCNNQLKDNLYEMLSSGVISGEEPIVHYYKKGRIVSEIIDL